MQKDTYFRLQDFYLAAFLFAKGLKLVDVDKITNCKRATFVFVDTPEREDLVEAFNYSKEDAPHTLVDGRKLILAVRTLKEKLYQNSF